MRANYHIKATWAPRIEAPELLTVRFKNLISLLKEIDLLTGKWFHVTGDAASYDIDELGERLIYTIIGRVSRGEFGQPEPWSGYHLVAHNRPTVTEVPESLWIRGMVGGDGMGLLRIGTAPLMPPHPDVISYKIFRGAVMAIA